jgi:hypothetical protein
MNYFATFISGTQDIINQRLAKFPNNELKVQELHDGLVLFSSHLSANQLAELRFFNNVYELFADLGKTKSLVVTSLPVPRLQGTFTLRVNNEGQPSSLPNGLKQYVEQQSGATFTAHQPDSELVLLQRSDGRVLWGKILPRAGFKLRRIEPGELRPELAHILGLVAGLDAKDCIADPFAGYGGIVREALQGFHVAEAIAIEQNEHLIPHLKSIPRLVALHGDARQLAHVHTRSIDRIVTDPPWGDYIGQTEHELRHLYHDAFTQMHRVLRIKGAIVILASVSFVAEAASETGFDVVKEYPILVNGRKAVIYKLRRLG